MSDAHCHTAAGTIARPGCETIVLVGNPNVGKSVVFNALTGTYVDVSNFPGTTVELTRGRLGEHDVVDTPGVYGVSSFNDEETVARDIILSGDIVVNVVDAVHLERDLFLTLQLVDMGKRMVVALNMADEARRRGLAIDRDLLEDLLGVPVIETVAVEGAGFDELRAAIPARAPRARRPSSSRPTSSRWPTRVGLARRGAHGARGRRVRQRAPRRRAGQPTATRSTCAAATASTTSAATSSPRRTQGASFSAKLSHAMMHPLTGIPMLLALLVAIYVGRARAVDRRRPRRLPRGHAHARLLGTRSCEGSWRACSRRASPSTQLLVGEFGVLTMTPDLPHRRHPAARHRLLPAAVAARGLRLPAEDRRARRPRARRAWA